MLAQSEMTRCESSKLAAKFMTCFLQWRPARRRSPKCKGWTAMNLCKGKSTRS